MQEQEQGLEKKERTVYLSSTGDFVNTDLTNPREIKYASEIQLYNQSRDKFYGLKPMNMTREEITKAALETTKRSYLKQAAAGVAAAGVQMGQAIYNFTMFTMPVLEAKTKRLFYKRGLDTQKKYGVISEEKYKQQLEELNAEYRGVRDTLNADLMAQREKQIAYLEKTGLGKKPEDSFLYDIVNGVGSAAAAIFTILVTKSPAAASAMFGTIAGQSGYEEALENGIAPEKALKVGVARGGAEFAFELGGAHTFLEVLNARGVLTRIGKAALTEGVQEMSQQTAEEILQTKYGGRKEDFRTAVNNIVMSGLVGMIVGGGFGAAGARKGASVKQGLEDTGKQEIKTAGSINITLEDAYFSGVKSLTDLGMPPEDAEKLTYSLLKKAAAPETLQVIREMLNEENSNLTYINNDEDQNAAAVKAAVEKATAPERVVREQAFNIADKVEEEALKAGREPEEAAASAALAQAASIGRYELTGVLPKDQIAINIESEEAASATENDLTGDEDASFDVNTFNQGPVDVKSPEFKAWFGDSKVVDENGEPLALANEGQVYKINGYFNEGFGPYNYKDAHRAPSFDDTPVNERLDYGGDFNLKEIVKGHSPAPEDYFSFNGPRMYGYNTEHGLESWRAINDVLQNNKKTITVYRAVPTDMLQPDFNNGEWITFSKKYAEMHGNNRFDGNYRIIEKKVPIKNVWWDGNDINEWGYDDGKGTKPTLYLKIENPKYQKEIPDNLKDIEKLREQGYDGIITPDGKYFVFTITQIKSVYNKGTFDKNNPNIYYQPGYHGSASKFDNFDLTHIGTGEGAQAHGWGVYIAGNRDTAEGYRKRLAETKYLYDGKKVGINDLADVLAVYNDEREKRLRFWKTLKEDYQTFINDIKKGVGPYANSTEEERQKEIDYDNKEIEDINKKIDFLENADKSKITTTGGQVYEVDIPNNNVLLDEQKTFEEQPKKVQEALEKIAKDYGIKVKGKVQAGVNFHDITGKYAYNQLAGKLGGQKAASQKMLEYGIEGITYDGKQDGRCYVVFDDKAVKILNTFYQGPRGSVSFADDLKNAFIRFNETADKSTLIHELSHIWLKDIERFAQISTKPEFLEFKENLDTWLGEPANGVYTVEQQEKFAKTFELYMQEGKAPNAELQGVFEKFKTWLREIYAAVKQYIELTPEAIKTFDTLLASEKGSYNIDKIRNKTAQAKAVVEKIKKGQAVNIEGVNIRDIKEALKVMRARIPAEPKENLLRTLRSKGADYDNAAKIDKEAYKNARVPNKKSGIQDNLALTLRDWGYMAFDDSAVADYNGLVEQNEIAADLIDKALNGEKVYKVGDQQAAKREQFLADVEAAREIVGEDSAEIARAITDLEKKGYRVIEKGDIDYLEKQLNQLDKIAEKAKLLEQNSEEQKKTEAFDKMQKQNALEARRIKTAVIEELEKRDLAGKDEMFKALEKAQTPEEIIVAADDILTELEREFANTEEGKAEQRKLDLPATNWEAKRITLLKDLAEISQSASEEIARAREITNQAHLANQGLRASLSKEEMAELEKARTLLKKTFEKKYLKAFNDALRDEPHIENKDVAAIMKVMANNAMEMRLVSDYAVKQFIDIARRKQDANYKKYVKGKIKAILDLNLFDKSGSLKKALVDPLTLNTLQQLKSVARMDQKQAADELAARMDRFAGQEEGISPADKIINELLSIKANDDQNISAQLFKQTYDDIHDLRQTGRSARNLQKIILDYQNEQAKSEVLNAIKKNKQAGFIKRTYASWLANWESMLDVFADKEIKEKYSMLNTEADTITHTWQRRKEIMDGVKRIYDLGSNREVQNKMNELREEKYTFTNYALVDKNEGGNVWFQRTGEPFKEELSKMQIITAYIYNQNDVLSTRLLQQYGQEQLDEMWSKLDAQDKQLANFLQQEAEKSYEQINQVFVRERGYDLPKVEKYFPSITERVESELDFLHASAMMSKNPSFIKMRANAAFVQMKLENPFGILFRHIDRAADYHFKAEKLNEIRRVFKSPVVKPAIIEKVGEDVYKRMLELIDQFSVQKQTLKYDIDKLGDWLTNNYVKGAIALKPTIAIKQLVSSINYAEQMPAGKWVKGFVDAVLHPKQTIDFMMKGDPYLKARYESGSMNEALARATADANAITAHGKFLRFTDLLTINTRLGDIGAIMFGGKPYVDFLMNEKGMSKQEAFAEFRKATLRSQQANTRSSLSTLQARDMNWLIRGLFAFKNTPAQYARKIADGISQYQRGEIDARQLGKVVGIYGLLNSWMYSMLTTLGLLAWFYDRKEAKELLADELVFSPFTQMAASLPVLDMAVGQAANIAKAKMFDHKVQLERPEMPVLSDIFKMGSKALKEDVSAEDVLDMLVMGGQIFGGLPTKYAKGVYTGSAAAVKEQKPMRAFLNALGYTENRAGKIVGEEKKKKKRKRRARKKKK